MQEQLISFETAKLAKEKGFNIETPKYWCNYYAGEPWRKWKLLPLKDLSLNFMEYPAPTQSLLQKWLRDVHKKDVYCWPCESQIDDSNTTWTSGKSVGTYEEALEVGLINALKLI